MQIFSRIARKSAETVHLRKLCSPGNLVKNLVFYTVMVCEKSCLQSVENNPQEIAFSCFTILSKFNFACRTLLNEESDFLSLLYKQL